MRRPISSVPGFSLFDLRHLSLGNGDGENSTHDILAVGVSLTTTEAKGCSWNIPKLARLSGKLTIVSRMLFYPAGTLTDPTTSGYSFLTNYFSDLGLTWSHSRQRNTVSAILFIAALTLAGAGLILFFLVFPAFLARSRSGKLLSRIGSILGVTAGIVFIGVALTPANLHLGTHIAIMMWAFRTFAVAVICYTIAIFREQDYPNRYGFILVAFAALLVLCVLLLVAGSAYDSPEGIMVQAVGQKTMAYAAVISILLQVRGA